MACLGQTAASQTSAAGRAARFLGGAATALVSHELGHVVFDLAYGAHPHLKTVHLGRIPFFAVAQRDAVTPRQEFIISSAGFWVGDVTTEWILSARPHLAREHAPFLKGMLAFHTGLAAGYAMAAFARQGPVERDPRGIADNARWTEPEIGALLLAPAALDAYRYFRGGSTWAAWGSRAIKAWSIVLVERTK
ncbi:MAG TPA: hypothetical protein VE967_04805 [Gemmatimonadaceae bacterium]|nr:hypothetical protein [Gemmatimonadaceae bacterium]